MVKIILNFTFKVHPHLNLIKITIFKYIFRIGVIYTDGRKQTGYQ
jgi:hypothetical protein